MPVASQDEWKRIDLIAPLLARQPCTVLHATALRASRHQDGCTAAGQHRRDSAMPETTISAPEHAPAITRTTLGITASRDTAAPGTVGGVGFILPFCSASEDE